MVIVAKNGHTRPQQIAKSFQVNSAAKHLNIAFEFRGLAMILAFLGQDQFKVFALCIRPSHEVVIVAVV